MCQSIKYQNCVGELLGLGRNLDSFFCIDIIINYTKTMRKYGVLPMFPFDQCDIYGTHPS